MNVEFYVHFGATKNDKGKVTNIRATRMTVGPGEPTAGSVVVKMVVDVPPEAFMPLEAAPLKIDPATLPRMEDAREGTMEIARDLQKDMPV